MNEIKIRNVEEKDAQTLVGLMEQLGYSTSIETLLENINAYQNNAPYFSCVAEKNNQVVASISVAITHYFHKKGKYARIVSMVTDENCRKQGVGKKLIQHVEEKAKAAGCDFVELSSALHRKETGTYDFYLSLGYSDAAEKKKYFIKSI